MLVPICVRMDHTTYVPYHQVWYHWYHWYHWYFCNLHFFPFGRNKKESGTGDWKTAERQLFVLHQILLAYNSSSSKHRCGPPLFRWGILSPPHSFPLKFRAREEDDDESESTIFAFFFASTDDEVADNFLLPVCTNFWNGKRYDKSGNIYGRVVNGVEQE